MVMALLDSASQGIIRQHVAGGGRGYPNSFDGIWARFTGEEREAKMILWQGLCTGFVASI